MKKPLVFFLASMVLAVANWKHGYEALVSLPVKVDVSVEVPTETHPRKPTVVVIGIAKDNAKHLPKLLQTIHNALNETSHIWDLERLVMFENDSKDKTPEIIQSWNDLQDPPLTGKVELIQQSYKDIPHDILYAGLDESKGRVVPNGKLRTSKIAYARNQVLKRLREIDASGHRIDYVLSLDTDKVSLNLKGVDTCFTGLPMDWGACCANQEKQAYYDLWALRTSPNFDPIIPKEGPWETWLQCDFLNTCRRGQRSAFRKISHDIPPIKVHSCFGGTTVYDFSYMRDDSIVYTGVFTAEYGEELNGTYTCEHVPFHDRMHKKNPNFTMYIQPRMVNRGP